MEYFKSILRIRRLISSLSCLFLLMCAPLALAQSPFEGRLISAEDVYENPDDHTLNLEYAKQEIKRGEMLNAASALERMLYANPNWHSSRLLYAAVLYQLDDQKAALRELSLLKGKELNTKQTIRYERYLTDFKKPLPVRALTVSRSGAQPINAYSRQDPVTASFDLGVRADNNAGNALVDEGFGFSNRGDVALHAQGRIRVSKPISADQNTTLRAAIGGQFRRQETFSQADYDLIDLQAGVSTRPTGKGRMSFDIDARRVNISGEKYLDQIGPRVTFSQATSETIRTTVSLSVYDQDYDALSNARLENERDGVRTRIQLGIQKSLKPYQQLTLGLGYDTKTAEISPFAYKGPQALLGFDQQFQNGNYLKTQIQLRQLNYKGSLTPTVDRRKETRISARQSLGIPLTTLVNNPIVKKVDLEIGVNYNERFSNIDTNDYKNIGADLKLKFNF